MTTLIPQLSDEPQALKYPRESGTQHAAPEPKERRTQDMIAWSEASTFKPTQEVPTDAPKHFVDALLSVEAAGKSLGWLRSREHDFTVICANHKGAFVRLLGDPMSWSLATELVSLSATITHACVLTETSRTNREL